MEKKKFQELAVRTESIVDEINVTIVDGTTFLSVLKSYIAITNVLDAFKKHIFYKKKLDRERVDRELTVAWSSIDFARDLSHGETTIPISEANGTLDMDPRIFHALLGSITEHGEIAQAMEYALYNMGELDLVNVCEELGDSDWYKALFYEATGIDWNDVQEMIIKKLEIRYKDKIFSEGEADERDLEAERALLESSIKASVDRYNNG